MPPSANVNVVRRSFVRCCKFRPLSRQARFFRHLATGTAALARTASGAALLAECLLPWRAIGPFPSHIPALLRPALPPYLMISEEHRFLFCGIPKVGLTEWLHLFLRVTGDSAWNTTRPWDYVHYTAKRQAFSMKKLQISAQRWDEIMRDPGFVKAVFLRDPAERILSAFMDKFVCGNPTTWGPCASSSSAARSAQALVARKTRYTKAFLDVTRRTGNLSFSDFVSLQNLSSTVDLHWRLQTNVCGFGHIPYNFVGDFGRVQEHARALLRLVGLWDTFGAHDWPGGGDGSMFSRNTTQSKHFTGASERVAMLFTPRLLRKVEDEYRADYAVINSVRWGVQERA